MRKYLIIINPVAGNGEIKYSIDKIKKAFENNNKQFDIVFSNKAGNITEIASNAENLGYTDIIAVGGDGTILEAFNGIIDSNINLGMIPCGTGNDFAKSLNIPINIIGAMEKIFEDNVKSIDIGRVNDQYFLNVAGVGIDADIVLAAGKIKNSIPGPLAYLTSTFKTLLNYKCKMLRIVIDKKEFEQKAYLVAIGNGKYFGGGMKITPDAELNDGHFDVCIVDQVSKMKFTSIFPRIFSGTHVNYDVVNIYKGKNIEIHSEERMHICADGNIVGETPCFISIIENGITVISG